MLAMSLEEQNTTHLALVESLLGNLLGQCLWDLLARINAKLTEQQVVFKRELAEGKSQNQTLPWDGRIVQEPRQALWEKLQN
jgi:hypothetical protein